MKYAKQNYRVIYPKLSSYYFFYFMVLGALIPYLGLYLQYLSFSAIEIGQILAVLMASKVIAPNIVGWIADKQAAPIKWVKISSLLALLAGTGLIVFETFWPLFWVVLVFSFFWHAALPQYESYTFSVLEKKHKHQYGKIRLWGSVGFIVAVLLLGRQIENYGIAVLPWGLLGLLFFVWLTTFLVKDKPKLNQSFEETSFFEVVKKPWVLGLLVVSFFMQFSHGTYYSFYSIYLVELGYEKTTVAWLWALGVLAEITVFFWIVTIMKHCSAKKLIILSLWLTLLRWMLIPLFPEHMAVLVFAQLLHAASFGLFHAAAIFLIDEHFKGQNKGKGQAVFAATSHGLGGALGLLVAGYAWSEGGAVLAFSVSMFAVVLALGFSRFLKQDLSKNI